MCKWLKVSEIRKEGLYLLHRTDDVEIPVAKEFITMKIHIYNNTPLFRTSENNVENLLNWDSECRFFGPIPMTLE
jgi:hypothetical protein